jgi:hypothetical protein
VLKVSLVVVVALVGLLGAVLAYATTRPDSFRVVRRARIPAPQENILALIKDFHRWKDWSPWERMDPTMKRSYFGPASGVGAAYAWEGTDKVGCGRMEILEATPSKVTIKLDFVRPLEAHNIVEFTLVPYGDATDVTWSMQGPNPFIAKVMSLVVSMDAMVGKDFEAGLANLKAATAS